MQTRCRRDRDADEMQTRSGCRRDRDADVLGASKDDRGHLVGWCDLYRARRGNVGEGRKGRTHGMHGACVAGYAMR